MVLLRCSLGGGGNYPTCSPQKNPCLKGFECLYCHGIHSSWIIHVRYSVCTWYWLTVKGLDAVTTVWEHLVEAVDVICSWFCVAIPYQKGRFRIQPFNKLQVMTPRCLDGLLLENITIVTLQSSPVFFYRMSHKTALRIYLQPPWLHSTLQKTLEQH